MIGKLKRSKNLSEANINRLVENVKSIESLLGIGLISFDFHKKQFTLNPFCWAGKDRTFKSNYVHSLSQYMILKNNGIDTDFTVCSSDGTALATYRKGGLVQLG
jgi:hypothetical protein